MRTELEVVTSSITNSPPLLAPVVALLGIWVWNVVEDQALTASCLDPGLIFVDALAQYGIGASLDPVLVTICQPDGTPITRYG